MRKNPRAIPSRADAHRTASGRRFGSRESNGSDPHGDGGGRPSGTTQWLWSCVLLVVPLALGLAVDLVLGWWPGLMALLAASLCTGALAYRAGRQQPDKR